MGERVIRALKITPHCPFSFGLQTLERHALIQSEIVRLTGDPLALATRLDQPS